MNLHRIIKNPNATFVDVRTPEEYREAHFPNSICLPVDETEKFIDLYKSLSRPIVLICNTGNRSGQTIGILDKYRIDEIYDAGNWQTTYHHWM